MKVIVSGQSYYINWKHLTDVEEIADYLAVSKAVKYSSPLDYELITICNIQQILPAETGKNAHATLLSGHAICRVEDAYVSSVYAVKGKITFPNLKHLTVELHPASSCLQPASTLRRNGRKRSLESALLSTAGEKLFNKQDRKTVWDEFNRLWPPTSMDPATAISQELYRLRKENEELRKQLSALIVTPPVAG